MGSPFLGQQVRNCNSFIWTHYLAHVFAMHWGTRTSPLCTKHCIQLIYKIWLWKSKVKVIDEVNVQSHNVGPTSYRLTSFWFRSMSIHPLIPMIELFLIWPSKSKGQVIAQGHTVGITSYRLKSLFVPFSSALPFLRYSNLKNWPWKSQVKFMGEVKVQSHNMSLTSYRLKSLWFHVNWPSHSWDTAFSKFDLENPRSRS